MSGIKAGQRTCADLDALGLTQEDRDELERLRKLTAEDSPMVQAYDEFMGAYQMQRLTYNNKRIAAATATGPAGAAIVADWAANAELFAQQVKKAEDKWIARGYRNEMEGIYAKINQMTARDMKLWKQRLIEKYEKGQISGIGGPGLKFFYTKPIPARFATGSGWTQFSFSQEEKAAGTSRTYQKFNGGVRIGFGLISFGGGASSESSNLKSNSDVSSFTVKLELSQVVISRPWFYPEFFKNRGWTLEPGAGWYFAGLPSDGGSPPKGIFIGYPTSAIFARNIEITSSELVKAYSESASSVSGGAGVGWGPFRLRGGYRRDTSDTKFNSTISGQTLKVPGMQIIGFVNELIPKSPDPLPSLQPSDFE